jgi:hypothetical protein
MEKPVKRLYPAEPGSERRALAALPLLPGDPQSRADQPGDRAQQRRLLCGDGDRLGADRDNRSQDDEPDLAASPGPPPCGLRYQSGVLRDDGVGVTG